jgi:hypothetical protein
MSMHKYPFRVLKDGAILGEYKIFTMATEIAYEHDGIVVNLDDPPGHPERQPGRRPAPTAEPTTKRGSELAVAGLQGHPKPGPRSRSNGAA